MVGGRKGCMVIENSAKYPCRRDFALSNTNKRLEFKSNKLLDYSDLSDLFFFFLFYLV